MPAGVALAGAGLIAVTQAAPPAQPHVDVSAIELTAADATDCIAPVFPTLQQIIVNQAGYVTGLMDGTLSIGQVLNDIGTNTASLGDGTVLFGAPSEVASHILATTLDSDHMFGYSLLPTDISPLTSDLVTFSASPLSGVLVGLLGPFISPFVSVNNSIGEALAALSGPTSSDTFVDLAGAPFNAQTLDLNEEFQVQTPAHTHLCHRTAHVSLRTRSRISPAASCATDYNLSRGDTYNPH
ncbi:hypothetical protein [Mycobacterium sp.]|uniref:hypothetical protein n=1 Tax=Mycobacterium sp. TaxID=1785 RepID=UPI0031DA76BB